MGGGKIKETMETLSICARISKLLQDEFSGLAALASSHPHLPGVTLAPATSSPQRLGCRIPKVIRAFVSNEEEQPCLKPKASPWCWLQGVNVDDWCCKSL